MTLHLTTQQLEYLVAVDRAPTWAEAAAEIGVTPSALSQGLAELERRLGVALFERTGRKRVPTRDHAPVLRYARATVAATAELAEWAARRRTGREGEVRLGLIDAAATVHCRAALMRFRADRPDVELRLQVAPSATLLHALERAELDLAACVAPHPPRPGLTTVPLLDEALTVLAPAGTAAGPAHTWGPWVSFPRGSHTRERIAEALTRRGARFDVVAESHQPEVLRDMVALGIGWAVLPDSGVRPGDDITVVGSALATRELVLARRDDHRPDAAVDALAGALVDGAATTGRRGS